MLNTKNFSNWILYFFFLSFFVFIFEYETVPFIFSFSIRFFGSWYVCAERPPLSVFHEKYYIVNCNIATKTLHILYKTIELNECYVCCMCIFYLFLSIFHLLRCHFIVLFRKKCQAWKGEGGVEGFAVFSFLFWFIRFLYRLFDIRQKAIFLEITLICDGDSSTTTTNANSSGFMWLFLVQKLPKFYNWMFLDFLKCKFVILWYVIYQIVAMQLDLYLNCFCTVFDIHTLITQHLNTWIPIRDWIHECVSNKVNGLIENGKMHPRGDHKMFLTYIHTYNICMQSVVYIYVWNNFISLSLTNVNLSSLCLI